MEGENNLIVSLGTLAAGEEDLKLEKLVDHGVEKTFRKILDYILDPKEDSLNPAYSNEERVLRDEIKGWKDKAERQEGSFDLMYIKNSGEVSDPVGIEQYPNDYSDIIKQKSRTTEFGEVLQYDGLDLVAKFEPVGGF